MKAYVFPGQGAQFPGMGKEIYDSKAEAKRLFERANDILGFDITDIMFNGTAEDLQETKVTQPAVFLHSVALALTMEDFNPGMVAGHSLGEFSALTAAGGLSFEDGLRLVSLRANAMQKACEEIPTTMAAIIGLDDQTVIEVCSSFEGGEVTAANFNCPGQIVISGSIPGIDKACEMMTEKGAKRALKLPVGGAFHSPYMGSAKEALDQAISDTTFNKPVCPIFQNVTTIGETEVDSIVANLSAQLVSPVLWTNTILNMVEAGATEFIEVGPGRALQGMIKKVDRSIVVSGIS